MGILTISFLQAGTRKDLKIEEDNLGTHILKIIHIVDYALFTISSPASSVVVVGVVIVKRTHL